MSAKESTTHWTYYNPVRVVFESGALHRLPELSSFERVALVTTAGFRRRGLVSALQASLGTRLVAVIDDVTPNPDVRQVDAQADRLRGSALDAVMALGGGSTIDTAKGLARLLAQRHEVRLTGHFRDGHPLEPAALPLIAIPTTSGTGAEVTPFGTIWDFERGRKYSITGDTSYPALAVLDPQLTAGLPPEPTLCSGLDAISHAFESAWNVNANPVTQGLVTQSLRLSLDALPAAMERPDDLEARARMMQASLLAGLAISQTRTALAHSISYPLTTRLGLPHGLACSFTLPALLEFNAGADDGRLSWLAHLLDHATVAELSASLSALFERLEVGMYFRRYVPDAGSVTSLLGEMIAPERASNNLRAASPADIEALVGRSLEQLHV